MDFVESFKKSSLHFDAEVYDSTMGSRSGTAVRADTSHQCGPGLILEFVVGSLLAPEFFYGYSGFPLSSKTNTAKFQFDPECMGTY